MSFAFNFGVEEVHDDEVASDGVAQGRKVHEASTENGDGQGAATRLDLDDMVSSLPLQLSYSRVRIPSVGSSSSGSSSSSSIIEPAESFVYRRDLFDARFQMLHDEDDEGEKDGEGPAWRDVMAGATTDLVPGVYEGGFKTWECSLDLAGYVQDRIRAPDTSCGRQVIELGCGTALPTLSLLQHYFCGQLQAPIDGGVRMQLCDFNEQVLRFVTLPNILLTWYFTHQQDDKEQQKGEQGELMVNEELVKAFRDDLYAKQIHLEFYSGHWQGLSRAGAFRNGLPSVILTSETIYSMVTMPSLLDTLDEAMNDGQTQETGKPTPLCLVAAKVLYFGVGGGVFAFEQALKRRRACAQTVWKSDRGVARVILQISFEQ